jgi:hypothetical protein
MSEFLLKETNTHITFVQISRGNSKGHDTTELWIDQKHQARIPSLKSQSSKTTCKHKHPNGAVLASCFRSTTGFDHSHNRHVNWPRRPHNFEHVWSISKMCINSYIARSPSNSRVSETPPETPTDSPTAFLVSSLTSTL